MSKTISLIQIHLNSKICCRAQCIPSSRETNQRAIHDFASCINTLTILAGSCWCSFGKLLYVAGVIGAVTCTNPHECHLPSVWVEPSLIQRLILVIFLNSSALTATKKSSQSSKKSAFTLQEDGHTLSISLNSYQKQKQNNKLGNFGA